MQILAGALSLRAMKRSRVLALAQLRPNLQAGAHVGSLHQRPGGWPSPTPIWNAHQQHQASKPPNSSEAEGRGVRLATHGGTHGVRCSQECPLYGGLCATVFGLRRLAQRTRNRRIMGFPRSWPAHGTDRAPKASLLLSLRAKDPFEAPCTSCACTLIASGKLIAAERTFGEFRAHGAREP